MGEIVKAYLLWAALVAAIIMAVAVIGHLNTVDDPYDCKHLYTSVDGKFICTDDW